MHAWQTISDEFVHALAINIPALQANVHVAITNPLQYEFTGHALQTLFVNLVQGTDMYMPGLHSGVHDEHTAFAVKVQFADV